MTSSQSIVEASCDTLRQDETLLYLEACQRTMRDALSAETPDTLQQPAGFSWLPLTRGVLYHPNIRHVQDHAGPLSAYLRKLPIEDSERWRVKTGRREFQG